MVIVNIVYIVTTIIATKCHRPNSGAIPFSGAILLSERPLATRRDLALHKNCIDDKSAFVNEFFP